jgi:hypothetical protein
MSKEKQIEEIAKALTAYEKKLCDRLPKDQCLLTSAIHAQVSCDYCKIAEFLYNAGYRKQSDGEWEDKPTGAYGRMQSWCSACGKHSGIGGIESNRHKPYCPNCGAKMKGGA